MSDTKQFEFSRLKELAVLVPLLGTAIAITYDVGFFWGLEINYFSFFSLTEHIVFAIEALPLALAVSFAVTVQFVLASVFGQRHKETAERATSALDLPKQLEWYNKSIARTKRAMLVGGVFSLASLVVGWFVGVPLSVLALNFCLVLYALGFYFYSNILSSPFFIANYVGIGSLLVTFAAGVDVQEWFVRRGKIVHAISLENSELTGRVVRAGERGVLFFNPGSREISFVRWDAVKRVRTLPQT